MYPISTISDILRQRVDSLALWLEHWISTLAIRVRILSETWEFFKLCIISFTSFHIRKRMFLASIIVMYSCSTMASSIVISDLNSLLTSRVV